MCVCELCVCRLYRFSLWATTRIVREDKINDNKSAENKLKPYKKNTSNNQIHGQNKLMLSLLPQ